MVVVVVLCGESYLPVFALSHATLGYGCGSSTLWRELPACVCVFTGGFRLWLRKQHFVERVTCLCLRYPMRLSAMVAVAALCRESYLLVFALFQAALGYGCGSSTVWRELSACVCVIPCDFRLWLR